MNEQASSTFPAMPAPGFVETFTNREARWRGAGGSWETGPSGVHVLASRVAAWYVCRAVRPPDHGIFDVTFTARDDAADDTAVAAVSVLTDQGHRALSAALDVKRKRLILFGLGTEVIAEMPIPWLEEGEHRLTLYRNGGTARAELDGAHFVQGPMRRSIKQGLIAFWTDPGVEATFHRLSVTRGFEDSKWENPPPDWTARGEGLWTGAGSRVEFSGGAGRLVKDAGVWDDVQVSAVVARPTGPSACGLALAGLAGESLEVMLSETSIRATVFGGDASEAQSWAIQPRPPAQPDDPTSILVLRRVGSRASLFLDGVSIAAIDVPTGPSEIALAAEGAARFSTVTAMEWL